MGKRDAPGYPIMDAMTDVQVNPVSGGFEPSDWRSLAILQSGGWIWRTTANLLQVLHILGAS